MKKATAGHKPHSTFDGSRLTRCLGYFKSENTVFKRSNSSEKCDQDKDKPCARSNMFSLDRFCTDCQHDSHDSASVDLN